MAVIDDQAGAGGLSLHQRVGGYRGTVDDDVDPGNEIARRKAEILRRDTKHIDEAFFEFARRGGRLEYRDGAAVVGNQTIGERTSDVDADVISHAAFRSKLSCSWCACIVSRSCQRVEIASIRIRPTFCSLKPKLFTASHARTPPSVRHARLA